MAASLTLALVFDASWRSVGEDSNVSPSITLDKQGQARIAFPSARGPIHRLRSFVR